MSGRQSIAHFDSKKGGERNGQFKLVGIYLSSFDRKLIYKISKLKTRHYFPEFWLKTYFQIYVKSTINLCLN